MSDEDEQDRSTSENPPPAPEPRPAPNNDWMGTENVRKSGKPDGYETKDR